VDNADRAKGRYGSHKKGSHKSWKHTDPKHWDEKHAKDYLNSDDAKEHQAMLDKAHQLTQGGEDQEQEAPPAPAPAGVPAGVPPGAMPAAS
jgi:hypothetical protein